jgi:hypothetical protein
MIGKGVRGVVDGGRSGAAEPEPGRDPDKLAQPVPDPLQVWLVDAACLAWRLVGDRVIPSNMYSKAQ